MSTWQTPAGRELHDVVRDIAAAMPADWQTVETPYDHGARIVGPDGAGMYARLGTYGSESGRLLFSVSVPADASYSDGDTHGVDRPEMTAAADRDPAAIARELVRKLVPAALEVHAIVSGRIARRLSAADSRETLARDLADRMGGDVRTHRDRVQASTGVLRSVWFGDITPNHDATAVAVELHSLPTARALELADMMGRWAREESAR